MRNWLLLLLLLLPVKANAVEWLPPGSVVGSAGTFSLTRPELTAAIEAKADEGICEAGLAACQKNPQAYTVKKDLKWLGAGLAGGLILGLVLGLRLK